MNTIVPIMLGIVYMIPNRIFWLYFLERCAALKRKAMMIAP